MFCRLSLRSSLRRWISVIGALFLTTPGLGSGNVDFSALSERAESGEAEAQAALGKLYAGGERVPQDYGKALGWYRKAAEQGYPIAQNELGAMYRDGRGVPRDYAEAIQWFREAANQGYPMAQFNLAGMYHYGQGVPQDYTEALKWLRMAAQNR